MLDLWDIISHKESAVSFFAYMAGLIDATTGVEIRSFRNNSEFKIHALLNALLGKDQSYESDNIKMALLLMKYDDTVVCIEDCCSIDTITVRS